MADEEHSSRQLQLAAKYLDTPALEERAEIVAEEMCKLRWGCTSDTYRMEHLKAPGLVVAAFFIAVMMPIVNIISIGALAAFTKTGKAEFAGVPKQIIQNPIIIACAIGWIWNGLGVPMPDTLDTMLYFLDRARTVYKLN